MQSVPQSENNNNQKSINIMSELNDGHSRSRFPFGFFRQESLYMSRFNAPQEESRDFQGVMLGLQDQFQCPIGNNSINFFNLSQMRPFQVSEEGNMKIQEELRLLDPNKRKGLKFLSWIINKLLRKNKCQSAELINYCVKYALVKEGQSANQQKELKNIKRRIYDAINVMQAVGLIVRNKNSELYIGNGNIFPEKIDKSSFMVMTKKKFNQEKKSQMNEKFIDKADQIERMQRRIQAKKEFIRESKKRIQSLKYIIARNSLNQQVLESQPVKQIKFPLFFLTFKYGMICYVLKKEHFVAKGVTKIFSEYQTVEYLPQRIDYIKAQDKNQPIYQISPVQIINRSMLGNFDISNRKFQAEKML